MKDDGHKAEAFMAKGTIYRNSNNELEQKVSYQTSFKTFIFPTVLSVYCYVLDCNVHIQKPIFNFGN